MHRILCEWSDRFGHKILCALPIPNGNMRENVVISKKDDEVVSRGQTFFLFVIGAEKKSPNDKKKKV